MEKYTQLLSPLKIGNVTLKNRMMGSKCALQSFTLEQAKEFYGDMARNGAATVTVAMGDHPERNLNKPDEHGRMPHMDGTGNDMRDPRVAEGYRKIAEEVHKYGTLASASLMDIEPTDVNISDTPNWDEIPRKGDYNSAVFRNKPGISAERLQTLIEEFAFRAKEARDMGFDMCTFYMSYRSSILATSMSPLLNQRTDRYGGQTMAERTTLAREVFARVKEVCGPEFLIEAQISAVEEEPGYTLEDFLDYCQALEGYVDIIQIRGVDGSATHVNGLNLQKDHPFSIDYAAAFKARGIKIACAPVGGYGDPEQMEQYLKEGKTDLFVMARQFLADDSYYEKLKAGAAPEEIVPCIRCNECHGHHTCAVNPRLGRQRNLFPETTVSRKVAVVGGGPAGLIAAITAAKRGHSVTLYESGERLGGQLIAAGVPDYKWPLREYLDYLLRELDKTSAVVHTGTAATAELLQGEGFDAIIAAVGSAPARPPVRGADQEHVWLAEDVFGREHQLGKQVVVIGGADTGRDVSLYLARAGHRVTMVTRGQIQLAGDMHTERLEREAFETNPNFSYVDFASTEEIGVHTVTLKVQTNGVRGFIPLMMPQNDEDAYYRDQHADGPGGPGGPSGPSGPGGPDGFPFGAPAPAAEPVYETRTLAFDDVVVSGGRTARVDAAEQFRGLAPVVRVVGDTVTISNLKHATYSGYKAAMQL